MIDEQYDEQYIKHEVELRTLKEITNFKCSDLYTKCSDLYTKFDRLSDKVDGHFRWTIGIMITMFGGLILTKLI